jgi:serine/threonine-protein kinase
MSRIPLVIGGKYVVTRLVGKGGMGSVYEALTLSGTRVAVKVMAEDPTRSGSQVARFEREARALASLGAPHVARVIETAVDPSTALPFIAMEYLLGEDLRQLLQRVGTLTPEAAVRIALQACAALRAAHEAGVLHRDIKPANLFLAEEGDRRTVKLLDFGIAKPFLRSAPDEATSSLTLTGDMLGSPQYMSPEHARGSRSIDERADVWSLGIVLYQMLCGRTPHGTVRELGELLLLVCTQPPQPIQDLAPWVTKELAAVVHRALRMSPEERFPSAAAFHEALCALLPRGLPVELPESSLRSPTGEEMGRVREKLPAEVLRDRPSLPSFDGGGPSSLRGSSRALPAHPGASGGRGVLRSGAVALAIAGLGAALYALSHPPEPQRSHDAGPRAAAPRVTATAATDAPPVRLAPPPGASSFPAIDSGAPGPRDRR